MAATLYPLHVPPRLWHIVGLNYLTRLHVTNGFDNVLIVVDHLTRMAHFLPCLKSVIVEETVNLFSKAVYRLHGNPECWLLIAIRYSSAASGRHFGDALQRASTCLPTDTRDGQTDGASQQHVLAASTMFSLLRWIELDILLPQVEFANNVTRALGIEHTPFEANFG
jgi:hypothetical protein